jgi:hypothetical protein
LKLHREFLFRGFRGRKTRVAVYRGAVYRSQVVFVSANTLRYLQTEVSSYGEDKKAT